MSPGQCSAQMVARILLLEVQEHKDWAAFLDWLPEQGPINLFSLLRSSAPQWVADFRFKPICPYDPIRLLLLRLSSKGVQTHHLFRARHDMAFHLPTSMMTLDPQFGSPKMGGPYWHVIPQIHCSSSCSARIKMAVLSFCGHAIFSFSPFPFHVA